MGRVTRGEGGGVQFWGRSVGVGTGAGGGGGRGGLEDLGEHSWGREREGGRRAMSLDGMGWEVVRLFGR